MFFSFQVGLMPDKENEVELIVSYIFILSSIKKSINKSA